jgi:hypothetical protein
MELLTERYKEKISGILGCYDRVIITGTIPGICFAQGMTSYLFSKGIRIFDYPKFAEPFREKLRANAEMLAKENGVEIEFVKNSSARKEDIVKKAVEKNGKKEGLLHILSAMEMCPTYKPWHDKHTGKTFLKGDTSKCLHYYFYFQDEELGYGYIRVPTWCPFRVQIYFNGHGLLSNALKSENIKCNMLDNSFDYISDFTKAQELSDNIKVENLHKILDRLAKKYCPVYQDFNQAYHWSIMQAEYSTDIVFKSKEALKPIYEELVKVAIHTVKPDNIATFLGQKLHGKYEGELGNNYNVRIEGSKIKHTMGEASIKIYDKFGKILRIETTVNNVSFFKHYRTVEHRDGTTSHKLASLKKNIYSLGFLQEHLVAANRRYLEFISAIEDHNAGKSNLKKLTQTTIENNRPYKGFNLFDEKDIDVLNAILRGEFNINGFRSKHIKKYLPNKSSSQITRVLKRLKLHGLIKKIGKTYKYYVTEFAKTVVTTCMKIQNLVIVPSLNFVNE